MGKKNKLASGCQQAVHNVVKVATHIAVALKHIIICPFHHFLSRNVLISMCGSVKQHP